MSYLWQQQDCLRINVVSYNCAWILFNFRSDKFAILMYLLMAIRTKYLHSFPQSILNDKSKFHVLFFKQIVITAESHNIYNKYIANFVAI